MFSDDSFSKCSPKRAGNPLRLKDSTVICNMSLDPVYISLSLPSDCDTFGTGRPGVKRGLTSSFEKHPKALKEGYLHEMFVVSCKGLHFLP